MKLKGYIVPFTLVLLLMSCGEDPVMEEPFEPPICSETFIPKAFDHMVVGFYPHYRTGSLPFDEVKWDKLTRIIYAFAHPGPEGSIDFGSLANSDDLASKAHENGVEVFFSLGGGGAGSNSFPAAVSTPENRKLMIQQVLIFLGNNCFDGVDIDYENFLSAGVEANLMTFIKELSSELKKYNYKISMDVYASRWGGVHVSNDIIDYVDNINIMAYDFSGPWSDPGPHSSFDQAIGSGSSESSTGLAYWENFRGFDKSKLLLGVPFYGRDFDNNGGAGITFQSIISMDISAAYLNKWNNIYYNGLTLMEQKAQHIVDNNYTGIMIWEIGQDATDPDYSLLGTIDEILNP